MIAPAVYTRLIVPVFLLALVVFAGCAPFGSVLAPSAEERNARALASMFAENAALGVLERAYARVSAGLRVAVREALGLPDEASAPPETEEPTTTPEVVAQPETELTPGDEVVVTFAGEGDGLPLFAQPGEIEIATMPAGTSLSVTVGNEATSEGDFVHVRSEYGQGWIDASNPDLFISIDRASEYFANAAADASTSPEKAEQALGVLTYLLGDEASLPLLLAYGGVENAQSWVLNDMRVIADFRARDFGSALENVTAALVLDPGNAFLYHHLTLANLSLGDLPAAQAALDQALIVVSDGVDQWAQWSYDQGLINLVSGDISAALDDFNTTLEIDPNHSEAYRYLGVLNGRAGNVDLGIENLTQAIEIDPAYVTPLVDVGRLYVQQGNLDLAIQNFDQAIIVDPNFASAYVERGALQYRNQEFDAAVTTFTTAIDIDAAVPQAHYYRGLIYYYQGQYQDSLDDCTRETEVNPRYANAYWCTGNADAALGQVQTAVDQYRVYISLAPSPNAAVVEYVNKYGGGS